MDALNDIGPVLCVIPARGGSKGLPGKNIRPLAGIPLIGHSIRLALSCPEISRAIVSTDSAEIADIARSEGAEVPFLRPPELAGDTTPMWPVLKHALASAEASGGAPYGALLLLDPTSPGRLPSDIATAVERLNATPDADGVIGVSTPEFNPLWHCVVEDGGWMRDLIPGADRFTRRQEVPQVYRINATLYLWRAGFVRREPANWRSGNLLMHEVPEHRAIHIDDIEEFRRADLMVKHGLIELPWLKDVKHA